MIRDLSIPHLMTFFVLLLLLVWVRLETGKVHEESIGMNVWSNDFSPVKDSALSGSLPGLFSDFRVLDVFSIYYAAKVTPHSNDMQYIGVYLNRAQSLDPRFKDVYKLAGSILTFDAGMAASAVDLLAKGSLVITDAWEIPFFGGFIAHQYLGDDEKAFELMKMVVGRPQAPAMAVNLATKYLNQTSSKIDAIRFLSAWMQSVPKEYQAGIKKKIDTLLAEIASEATLP